MDNQKFYNVLCCIGGVALVVFWLCTGKQIMQPMTFLFAWRTMMYASGLWDRLKDK